MDEMDKEDAEFEMTRGRNQAPRSIWGDDSDYYE